MFGTGLIQRDIIIYETDYKGDNMKIFFGLIMIISGVLGLLFYWLGRKNIINYQTQQIEAFYIKATRYFKWMIIFTIVNIMVPIIYFILIIFNLIPE